MKKLRALYMNFPTKRIEVGEHGALFCARPRGAGCPVDVYPFEYFPDSSILFETKQVIACSSYYFNYVLPLALCGHGLSIHSKLLPDTEAGTCRNIDFYAK